MPVDTVPLPMAYLHGFASSARSSKGVWLAQRMAERGRVLHLPDLNRPSFGTLTISAALEAIDALDDAVGGGRPWCIVGSSMGGFLAALWAQLHPERVHRLLLLCPGFGLPQRWPSIIGADAFARWERAGSHPFPDAGGELVRVHWRFIEDARTHPGQPQVACPTRIVHGRRDEVVPVALSRDYAARHPQVELIEVDDDHGLASSVERIYRQALELFDIT